ncbi:MAG TPA: type IV pilus assembly protein PilM [Elusimicrobiota bacterium]|nr:type IV pilus assembly protein PilM [Elusimicrobiota bacterium]
MKAALKGMDIRAIKDRLGGVFVSPQDVIGVDVGSYAVKVVHLAVEGNARKLLSWGYLPLEAKPEASAEDRKQKTINLLKAFVIQKGLVGKHAATAISGNSVIVRYVKFPLLTKGELQATLATEAEPFIPFDIKDVQLGFHILAEILEDGQRKMETVLVAAKRDAVQGRVDVLEAAGLKPTVIDVDSFALENVHERVSEGAGPGTALYLNLGHTVTNLSIVENGATRVVRDVFISGNTFTKAVMKSLQCDYAKAEEAKKKHGLLIDAEEKEKALREGNRDALGVSQAISTVMKDLVSELHRSVDFYLSQGPERSIARIVLAGGTAKLRNVARYLTTELKVPVTALNPLSFSGAADLPEEILPAMAVAAGLALRRNGDWK